MPRSTVDLSLFNNAGNSSYVVDRSLPVQIAWFFIGLPVLRCPLLSSSRMRVILLRMFGATIGNGVVIKPGVRVKFPWKLSIGEHSWIGEDCWIDNLATVEIGSNVCISQSAYLCTGSHDWSDRAFRLITRSIRIEDGAWVGAKAVLAPGTVVEEHAVVGLHSMASGRIPAYEIHVGNPAKFIKRRQIGCDSESDQTAQKSPGSPEKYNVASAADRYF